MARQRPERERAETKTPGVSDLRNKPAGLIAMIPNQIMPEESKRHLWAARREFLLAMRSLASAGAGMLTGMRKRRKE